MKIRTLGVVVVATLLQVAAKDAGTETFWVYQDAAARVNHYIPAGWMGDYGDLKINQRWEQKPASGRSAIQIKYSAEKKQGAGWAGIYWQDPANNWGDKRGGFDLSKGGFKKLKFKARGEKGREYIEKFMVGGITGQSEPGDSASADSGGIELTKEWVDYSIDLADQDLTEIIGGFGFVVSADSSPNGVIFYIDDVRYEK